MLPPPQSNRQNQAPGGTHAARSREPWSGSQNYIATRQRGDTREGGWPGRGGHTSLAGPGGAELLLRARPRASAVPWACRPGANGAASWPRNPFVWFQLEVVLLSLILKPAL